MAEADATATGMVTGAADNPKPDGQHNQAQASGSAAAGDWGTGEFAEVIKQKGWKSPGDAVKSYVALEKFASKSVQDMDQEEREKFYKRLGRPEKPDELVLSTLTLPEGFEVPKEFDGELRKVIHQSQSLPMKEQAKLLHEWLLKRAVDAWSAARSGVAKKREADESALRNSWLSDYDGNNAKVDQLIRLGGDDVVQYMNNGPGKEPVMRQWLLKVASMFAQETLVTGKPPAEKAAPSGFVVDFAEKSPELMGDGRYGKR